MYNYTTIVCQKINKRNCLMIAQYGDEDLKLQFKIPIFKTKRKIWIFVHEVQRKFKKNGFNLTGAQVSSALCVVYANIPYVYY